MVEALDNQEANRETYLSMSFDARLNLLIDECYTAKNNDRAKRLLRCAKLRYPNADINTMCYEGRDLTGTLYLILEHVALLPAALTSL